MNAVPLDTKRWFRQARDAVEAMEIARRHAGACGTSRSPHSCAADLRRPPKARTPAAPLDWLLRGLAAEWLPIETEAAADPAGGMGSRKKGQRRPPRGPVRKRTEARVTTTSSSHAADESEDTDEAEDEDIYTIWVIDERDDGLFGLWSASGVREPEVPARSAELPGGSRLCYRMLPNGNFEFYKCDEEKPEVPAEPERWSKETCDAKKQAILADCARRAHDADLAAQYRSACLASAHRRTVMDLRRAIFDMENNAPGTAQYEEGKQYLTASSDRNNPCYIFARATDEVHNYTRGIEDANQELVEHCDTGVLCPLFHWDSLEFHGPYG